MSAKGNKKKGSTVGKPWQEFEKLVAKIEKFLSPSDSEIKLNDMVPDIHTGTLRQVDATIRHKLGSTKILIAIECRERGAKQDVTWVEQLASKKLSIGASELIGVSSTGFSKEAIQQAKFKGVILRKLDKVHPREILSVDQFRAVHRDYNLAFVKLEFIGLNQQEAFGFLNGLTDGPSTKTFGDLSVFRKQTQQKTSSMMELFSEFLRTIDRQGGLNALDIPREQHSVPHVLDISFSEGNLLLCLPTREISVGRVQFEFTIGNFARDLKATSHQIYSFGDDSSKIAEITNYHDEHEGRVICEYTHSVDRLTGKSSFEPVLGWPQLTNPLSLRPADN